MYQRFSKPQYRSKSQNDYLFSGGRKYVFGSCIQVAKSVHMHAFYVINMHSELVSDVDRLRRIIGIWGRASGRQHQITRGAYSIEYWRRRTNLLSGACTRLTQRRGSERVAL